MKDPIQIEAVVGAELDRVWHAYIDPESVIKWNAASDDWHSPRAENDLREGGRFSYRMEAKDGSEGFDFSGTYTAVVPREQIAYTMDDGRQVEVTFVEEEDGVRVATVFEPETENSRELQAMGWQAILDNFKRYVESNPG